MRTRTAALAILAAAMCAVLAAAPQGKREREDPNTRSVQGFVEDAEGRPVEGAVVQLKNKKTLQVRSFITQKEGAYYFHGLSTDVDYELRAEHQGRSSATRNLSVFDSRRKAIINLRLEDKK